MIYECEKCGRRFEYMPDYGICPECGGRVGTVMLVIEFIRHSPEEGNRLVVCPQIVPVCIKASPPCHIPPQAWPP